MQQRKHPWRNLKCRTVTLLTRSIKTQALTDGVTVKSQGLRNKGGI
jgi:hypothetical protein